MIIDDVSMRKKIELLRAFPFNNQIYGLPLRLHVALLLTCGYAWTSSLIFKTQPAVRMPNACSGSRNQVLNCSLRTNAITSTKVIHFFNGARKKCERLRPHSLPFKPSHQSGCSIWVSIDRLLGNSGVIWMDLVWDWSIGDPLADSLFVLDRIHDISD